MTVYLTIAACIILLCVLLNRLSFRFGVPMLLMFIVLGMVCGIDGLLGIPFDNYKLAEQICSTALIFIMFTGGFGTNWPQAKPVAVKAAALSTVGVFLTALLTGGFCYFVLKIQLWESFLIGAILSSTDAASVFSILRSKKLGLKENTASLLEMESGSNDPCSYMLTAIVLSVMNGKADGGQIALLIVSQLVFGVLFGAGIAVAARLFLSRFRFGSSGFDMTFFIGLALLSYGLPSLVGGNGYLSAYIVGIVLGNSKVKNKAPVVNFFDGLTSLMQILIFFLVICTSAETGGGVEELQILIFFLLGLLATPSQIPAVLPAAAAIAVFMTFAARPLAVFGLLSPARCSIRQQVLVSFAGLRGAASIVFAIMATVHEASTRSDVYHIVFCIVLLSMAFQGSLLAPAARKLNMCDKDIDVLKTFSDYSEEVDMRFICTKLPDGHEWVGKALRDLLLPPDTLIVMLLRGEERIVPSGRTVLQAGDVAVLSARAFVEPAGLLLTEQAIAADSPWAEKRIAEFSPSGGELVILILRNSKTVIPKGDTRIKAGDVLVIASQEEALIQA